ncbi:MAG: hypothetical protein WDA47_07520 [Bacilli bacterium]|jgi:hypothetical protein
MEQAITTAVQSIQADLTGIINVIGPVAVAICGLVLAWRVGLKVFKSLVGKA